MDDPRQAKFKATVDDISKKLAYHDVSVVPTDGPFIASCVNLGFLQNAIRERYEAGEFKTQRDVETFLMDSIQRVKILKVEINGTKQDHTHINIEIATKDDLGYYDYKFEVIIR